MITRSKLSQSGFTLVELAIVLLIVGILIAGILKGQELIENSRMTATIQQIKSYEAAINTFRDSFGGLPGDIQNAAARVPGCAAGVGCQGGTGNGIIGAAGSVAATGITAVTTDERAQMWLHMALANLITGIVPNYNGLTTPAWGVSMPAARIGGGMSLAYSNATAAVAGVAGTMAGHYLTLQQDAAAIPNVSPLLQAEKALQLDIKLDDGVASTGDVIGLATTCFTGTAPNIVYVNNTDATVCALAIRVMN